MSYPTYPNTYKKDIQVGNKTISIEIGKFSEQVSAAVLVTCGETVVHSTVALGRKINLGYFPLSVEFAEKLYAAGIIKGSRWVKRDGRPLDEVILKARVIDRSLRPLFPEGLTNEVQVINTVFSYDGQNDPDMLGLLGSAIGLAISEIPFDGPMAGLRIGYNKETSEFLTNPTYEERDKSSLDLIVAGSGDAVVMVEAGANEIIETVMVEALIKAQEEMGKICTAINEIVAEIGKDKIDLIDDETKAEDAKIEALADKIYKKNVIELKEIVKKEGKLIKDSGLDELKEKLIAQYVKDKVNGEAREGALGHDAKEGEASEVSEKEVLTALYSLTKRAARELILIDGVRPDGRKTDEIRQIWTEVDVFPRTHGSAMFKRGATQGVTVVTLADPSRAQLTESIRGEEELKYFHHYSMPPYASGEAGRFGFPKRREIGHGALAERALRPMLPSQEEFPYTIHVVTEIMSSNGSTSQAAVCGSTLSLMAAGVPIKRPVAGIAMGLMSDGKQYIVLSDIQGLEDHVGDMDFKVAGTTEGITAIQMDIKLKGIPRKVLEEALEQAKVGRLHIMGEMLKSINAPRTELSQFAPKVKQITIPASRIGELIGPGGKMIKSIIEKTGAEISVDEDKDNELGLVNISSPEQEKIDAATKIITNMMRVVEVGEEFDGVVTRVESYGAFVEYLDGKEGLVHVSAMNTEFVKDAGDFVKVGDSVHVMISEIKDDGKIGLSMLTKDQQAEVNSKRESRPQRPSFRGGNGGSNGSYRGGDRGGSRGGNRGGNGGSRGGNR
ncbi:MAG: polyribonucleotide nucleotidyltransferase [Candidatus Pacebacteria bacterium CG11_big_fil_rev_8_21_14_0_20_34_55]|nr:polyribonucleotide nucleotidyltransferase [Candidatus Paceibacterota bacterium]NCS86850.1 polyribonucleotide nucleotidyltransferase [Candidatus Paceibacterota bacterium]PIQ81152.1 MAG: polyribonucleotide nucleotidyltransferase [Candidatus Pacebacteria bacterium CG11_big_fil_rev_8_21_14_0_20_34_55]PJC43564.1 MAG: polyribonucleotide nucleotidyltransferase [Candidatus Pacebacteria bacterium CG_4_9_14_0_2_um_filter_34_50]